MKIDFTKIKKGFTIAAQKTKETSESVLEIAKLKYKLVEINSEIEETFKEIDWDSNGPKGYVGYRDSSRQHVVAQKGKKTIAVSQQYQDIPIYKDERRIFDLSGKNISPQYFLKILWREYL